MKRLKDYTQDEFSKMTDEEIDKLMEFERGENFKEELRFKQVEYPNYSFEKKVKFWGSTLHRNMRWLEEDGDDPYSIYSLDWYRSVKEKEPNIDDIMKKVISKYWGTGADWSKEEYLKRIKK